MVQNENETVPAPEQAYNFSAIIVTPGTGRAELNPHGESKPVTKVSVGVSP
jgi:hypothetical protein